jgi:hypothetical protein
VTDSTGDGGVEVLARRGGALVGVAGGVWFVSDDGHARQLDAPVNTLLAGPEDDEFLAGPEVDPASSVATVQVLRAADGSPVGGPVRLPADSVPVGSDGAGGVLLAVPGFDTTYRLDLRTGVLNEVAAGRVLAASGATLVSFGCDEHLACSLVATGPKGSVSVPSGAIGLAAAIDPAGARVVAFTGDSGGELLDLATHRVVSSQVPDAS